MNENKLFLTPNFENIPDELRQQPWAVWIAEPRIGQPGKVNKAPRSPLSLKKIGANDPSLFGTFSDAYSIVSKGKCTGIGLLLTGNGLVGIDIDGYEELAQSRPGFLAWLGKAISRGVYCEKSPSGKGRRLFLYGSLPNNGAGRKHEGLEIYGDKRFLTVTGATGKRNGTRIVYPKIVEAQDLIDEFLSLLPQSTNQNAPNTFTTDRSGEISRDQIPGEIRAKLPELFMPESDVLPGRFRSLYEGDTSAYGDDHSAADLAFTGFARASHLTPDETDILFRSSGLYRPKWDEMRGQHTYGELTVSKAFSTTPITKPEVIKPNQRRLGPPDEYLPIYHPLGMPPREFAGPTIESGIRLLPLCGLSTLAGLGATGKTTVMLNICAHIAAGKAWGGHSLRARKVVFAAIEETQDELNRKFSAVVDSWGDDERARATINMRLIPLQGQDARLTQAKSRQIEASGWSEDLIDFCRQFELKDGVIVLDHLQGFASGDLNTSETVTAICREANKVAAETGSAVVILSHTTKANIRTTSEEISQGFVSGSLAFENAMRQTMVLVKMSDSEAKSFGITEGQEDYVWLGIPKNSYGKADSGIWFKKTFSPKFHSVTIEPVSLAKPVMEGIKTAQERILELITKHLREHPWTSRNTLEKCAGVKGQFKASAKTLRQVIDNAIQLGQLELAPVTASERSQHGLPKQVKEVLRATA